MRHLMRLKEHLYALYFPLIKHPIYPWTCTICFNLTRSLRRKFNLYYVLNSFVRFLLSFKHFNSSLSMFFYEIQVSYFVHLFSHVNTILLLAKFQLKQPTQFYIGMYIYKPTYLQTHIHTYTCKYNGFYWCSIGFTH